MRNTLGSKDYHVLPSWLPSIVSETCCMIEASAVVNVDVGVVWVTKGLEQFPFPVQCCSEAFVATREAESFIMFYLVPKFDKTSFYFSP